MRLILFLTVVCCTLMSKSNGQNNLSISAPLIYSRVSVKNNWSPSTAVNRKDQFDGSAIGSGININYSFRPTFIFKDRFKHLAINIGVGYFNQRFNIIRYFNYDSPVQIVFSTDHYSYNCWQGSLGLAYNSTLKKKYFLSFNLNYSALRSFRQEYTLASGDSPQVNKFSIDFGRTIILSLGVQRNLGKKISAGLNVLLPYTSWRNDKIFNDDPSTFSHPSFSLGSSLSLFYFFSEG